MKFGLNVCAALVSLLVAFAAPALGAASKAYRLTDLDLRDPHTLISFIGCRDITDTPLAGFSFNGNLQTSIQTDSDQNGTLDMSLILVFDPLDQGGSGGAMRFGSSTCTAPMAGTICGPNPGEALKNMTAVNDVSGTCLGVLAETTIHSYSPAINKPSGPCFSSDPHLLTLDLGGIPLTLYSAQIAGTYSGSPAGSLVNGLIRGFLTETDANATIIPSTYALIGGMPFSELLPGGDPPGASNTNCASWSDRDLGPDGITPGWWMYFNFAATAVPYTGPQLDAPSGGQPSVALSATPSPFRSSVTLEYALEREGPARVAVYDLFGRAVATLASGRQPAGVHRLTWDGRGAGQSPAPPGLYVVRLVTDAGVVTRTIVRLK